MSTTEPRTNLNRPAHEASARTDAPSRLGAGSGIIILLLLLLLIAAGFVAYVGWTLADGIEVSTAGYVAMAIGVLFSLLVGCGLMALVFYSSRSGYDEPPVLIEHRPDVPSQSGRVTARPK